MNSLNVVVGEFLHQSQLFYIFYFSMQASIVGYCSCLVIIDVWMIAQLLKAQLVYLQFLYVAAVNINEVKGFFWKITLKSAE